MTKTLTRQPRILPPAAARQPLIDQSAAGPVADGTCSLIFYEPDSGRIRQVMPHCSPLGLEHMQLAGCARLAGIADFFEDYVDLASLLPQRRPEILSLEALPVPATVTVTCRATGSTNRYLVEDGSFEYDDLPGVYDITVSAWPHHDACFVLEITP